MWSGTLVGLLALAGGTWWHGFLYLVLSELFLHGFAHHPYFGYFVGVHNSRAARGRTGGAAGCQPTMSTYSVFASLACLNLNYHVEHHDFPAVPCAR